jgi:hypothetical protein
MTEMIEAAEMAEVTEVTEIAKYTGREFRGQFLRGKPFWKRVFPLNPFPKTFKSFGKMAWKKPFFKRVSSNVVDTRLTAATFEVTCL